MTVGGPAIGSALFAYGHFGDVDAGYLGVAIALSAFTLLPYAVVLLQLRVFYARQQPWIPIAIIVIITIVKIAASLLAPHITDNPDLVAGYLGLGQRPGIFWPARSSAITCCGTRCGPPAATCSAWRRCGRFWSRSPRRCWPG